MIVTAVSTFYDHISRSFRVPARPGRYYRSCPDCGDCCCGWPVEWAPPGSGRDNVVVVVEDDCHD